MDSLKIIIRKADLNDTDDKQTLTDLIDRYMKDPKGAFEVPGGVNPNVAEMLAKYSHAIVFFALLNKTVIGFSVCFIGFSTFRAKELLNIHDLFVLPEHRQKGAARALLNAVEQFAKERCCCKISLEVREDNFAAQKLYRSINFNNEAVPVHFWVKYI